MRTLTCHCGAVELSVRLSENLSNARRCDCSFCGPRGPAVVFAAPGDVTVIRGQDALTLYQWNTHQEEHYFCSICGIYTHHSHADPAAGYAVNLGALKDVNPADFEPIPWLDGVNYSPKIYPKDPQT